VTVSLVAVGDVSLRGESPETQLDGIAELLRSGDVTFGQLETPLSPRGTRQLHPGFRGQVPDRSAEENAKLLAAAGFTVMSFAGNHTMDRSATAMLETVEAADAVGLRLVGAGRDLAAARTPTILEVDGTRIGMLAYCSVVPRGFEATAQRAGVAPLRARTFYEQVDWQAGTPPRIVTQCHAEDLQALADDVARLRTQVDVVVVSMHWGIHFEHGTLADYEYEAGHAAVDAGADLVLGHHGHVVKGFEYYRGVPILHSIGNVTLLPRGEQGEPLLPGGRMDAQFQAVVRVEIDGGKVSRVAVVPVWLDEVKEPRVITPDEPLFAEFGDYLRRANDLASTPRDPWEVLYLKPLPASLSLREVGFEADGGEYVVLPPR
jgi:poly-gamma-glutamate capsule biosynthesis protein CapA/YwtB (metallophosphatase superfamily)